ncbi:hypothetical protein [Nostoc sp.]|uniref:hypothetical protein n=1 Tax=Nostoc sp. TaxID=1180 RepID=UPI002FF6A1E5
MKTLTDLITEASCLIGEIEDHPDYQRLLDEGYTPDLNIADCSTALAYLSWVVDPPSAPPVPEIEVTP